ncbi:MAG TPA: protein-glutamate O-methyltransferase [Spirochaetota bacterium]|nr:protein-glutamate O-methyltransferase [Spirochaetota bacterium]HPS86329.1 protein-glutamate O-methyltransferase [Spirochaetota bacterium]
MLPDKIDISGETFFPGPVIMNMSDNEFSLFSTLIFTRLGIKMPQTKKLMLISRLTKRLRALGYRTYKEYYDYLCSAKGESEEFNKMIDAVTTNKTDFFREPDHFDILVKRVLPDLTDPEKFTERKVINIWSAGCSTGEEAYTLTMVMSEYFSGVKSRFSVLATDISPKVLQAGKDAIYTGSAIEPIPVYMRQKYLMRGTGDKSGLFKIIPALRERVTFKQLNFMDRQFNAGKDMDIIFCRNVIIYFDKETQKELFKKFYQHLVPGGYLFIGSSETLYGVNSDFIPAGPTVYRKPKE